METNYKTKNGKARNDAIISHRFSADHDTTFDLWISSHCSSILINNTSSNSAKPINGQGDDGHNDPESRIIDRAFTFNRTGPATSRFGIRDFTLRDSNGIELLRIRRQASATWRNLYHVYRGETRVMSIREGNLSHWNHNLHVFLEKGHADYQADGSVNTRSGRHTRPDYKLKRLTGLYYSCNVVLGVFDGQDDHKMAEAQMYPHSWLSWRSLLGWNPDYKVTIHACADQAFIALLLNLYNVIASDYREIYGGV